MSRYNLAALAAVAGALAFAGTANATIIESGSVGGAPTSGVNHETFNSLTPGDTVTTVLPNGLTVSFAPDGQPVQGAVDNKYARPYFSGGNSAGFGGDPDGPDDTTYLTSGVGSVTLAFSSEQRYLGILWGSIDPENTLSFYNGGSLVQAFSGTDILGGANGDQGVNGTLYVNFTTSDTPFDSVVLTSSTYAFEFDNVAFGERVPVNTPEPITLSLFGAGLAGLGFARRRRKA
jgi:hypothetical protein